MKKVNLLFVLLLSATFVVTSCKKDEPEDTMPTEAVNNAASGSLNLGAKVVADFYGEVRDENGAAISDVTITIGDKTGTTDANGLFSVLDASVDEDLAYVKAEKSGYFLGSRSLIPDQTATNAVRITMLSLDVTATIVSNTAVTVTADGGSVDLKGEYVDEVGNPYSGVIEVSMKFLPGTDPNTGTEMPGMLYAENENGESGALETYGMIGLEMFGNSGQRLQIAAGSDATIHIPVDASQLAGAPATIPLWYFDEAVGYWVEEGQATLENGEYVGVVDHFSFWNCDDFTVDAQVCGFVLDPSGNPFPNAQVSIITSNASTTGTTSSGGYFCTYIPANESISFELSDECGNVLMTQTAGPFTANSVNTVAFVAMNTTNTLQVIGSINDCSSTPVANGLIEIIIGANSAYFPIVNGAVNVSLNNCALPATIDAVVTDYATLSQGQISNLPVVGNTANIGTLNACTPAAEYISLTIDGNTNVFINSLDCFKSLDSIASSPLINFDGETITGDYIYIQGSTNTPGNYAMIEDTYLATGFSVLTNVTPGIDFTTPPNVTVNLVNFVPVGNYIDLTMVGTFYDAAATPHSINIDVHMIRDL